MSAGSSMRRGVEAAQNQALKKPSAVERLDNLEAAFKQLVESINENFKADRQVRESIVKTLNAVTDLVGEEKVQAKLQERDLAELEKRADDAEQALDKLVTDGRVVESLSFSDKTVVIKVRQLKDGVVMPPRHLILPPDGLTEEVRNLLPGTSAGESLSLADGTTVEILALFEAVEVPAETPVEVAHPDAIIPPAVGTTDFVEVKAPIEVTEVKAE